MAPSVHYGLNITERHESFANTSIEYDSDSSLVLWETRKQAGNYEPKQRIDFRLRAGFFLKSNDVLGFHLGYRMGLDNMVSMEYRTLPQLANEKGTGFYHLTGNEFYFGASYMFNSNSNKKREEMSDLSTRRGTRNKNDARVERKRGLELQRSNSYKIAGHLGFNMIRENIADESYFDSKLAGPGFSGGLSVTKEEPKHYIGGQLTYNEFNTRFRNKAERSWMETYNFYTGQLGFVVGSYWRSLSKHKRYLSFEGGLHAALRSSKNRNISYGNTDSTEVISVSFKSKNKVYPLAHIGVSSTLRLYQQLYIDFGIKYYQGFYPIERQQISYQNWNGINLNTERKSNGSHLVFSTGLSVHLLRKRMNP